MDRLQIIDNAIKDQFLGRYAPLVKRPDGNDSKVWWVGSRRDFASLYAQPVPDEDTPQNKEKSERLKMPRIAIQRLDARPDVNRQRPTTLQLRSIGRTDDDKRVYSSPLPIPVNMEYQIDFWTRRISEMNRWEIQWLTDFQQQVYYTKVRIDDYLFQDKYLGLLADAALEDNSDLEPGEDRPLYRKTARLTAPTWLFPTADDIESCPTVRELYLDLYELDVASGIETYLGRIDP